MRWNSQVRTFVILSSLAVGLSSANGGEQEPSATDTTPAVELRVTTTSGARFTGHVAGDSAVAKLLADRDSIDAAHLAPGTSVRLQDVNGLTGSMGLSRAEIVSIEKVGTVDPAALGERKQKVKISREQSWEKERARLAAVNADRAARAKAEALEVAAAEAAAAEAALKLPPELQQWIDLYPPADGWVPAMKQQIYHQTIILNNRAPTAQEKQWLEDYDAWKVAYDAWRKIELDKAAREEKAKAEGKPQPTGTDKSEASGTAGSAAGGLDPANPSTEDAAVLPPKLKPDVKAPVAIKKDVALPRDLEKNVAKPVGLKNGTEP